MAQRSVPPSNRWQVPGLVDGRNTSLNCGRPAGRISDWTQEQACVPGAVTGSGPGSFTALPLPIGLPDCCSLWSVLIKLWRYRLTRYNIPLNRRQQSRYIMGGT